MKKRSKQIRIELALTNCSSTMGWARRTSASIKQTIRSLESPTIGITFPIWFITCQDLVVSSVKNESHLDNECGKSEMRSLEFATEQLGLHSVALAGLFSMQFDTTDPFS